MIYSIIYCPECGCKEVICFNDDILNVKVMALFEKK